jgi:diguanylate cyclase (GGDEF)-like protein/PAS domain S-box-containing protein
MLLLLLGLAFGGLFATTCFGRSRRAPGDASDAGGVLARLDQPFIEVGADGRVLTWNDKAQSTFGWQRDDVVGRELAAFFVPEQRRHEHRQRVAALRKGRLAKAEGGRRRTTVLAVDGTEVPVDMTSWVTVTSTGPRLVALLHDERERLFAEQQLRAFAEMDYLTGLFNRRVFQERLNELAVDPAGAGVLMFIDLDGFKLVNDSFGHGDGDRLLLATAERIRRCLSSFDGATAARLGGDEFALLLPGIGVTEGRWLAASLASRMRQPFRPQSHACDIQVSASIGLALVPRGTCRAEELLRNADLAMYAAKRASDRSWRQFEPAMADELLYEIGMEVDLQQALLRDELEVHYQPIVSTATGAVTGLEALVRWRHPRLGLLGPDRFIPMAEKRNVVSELGEVVLHKACCQLAIWRSELGRAAPPQVAVNVSPIQLRNPAFVDGVRRALGASGLPPQALLIEVTETAYCDDMDRIGSVLGELRALGIRLAIDDFGTGYSSLSRLRDLSVDVLKVDRSFTAQIRNDADEPMVRAIVGMAEGLGLSVTVEGVETDEQLRYVRQLGASAAQGFLVARPMPPDVLGIWLRGYQYIPEPRVHEEVR